MKYEYLTTSVVTISSATLDEYGNEGWRLIQIVPLNSEFKTLVWEREVK